MKGNEMMCGLSGICHDCIGCEHAKPHEKNSACEFGCMSADSGRCADLI